MKKKSLVLALMLFTCMTFAQKSFAASDVETYTVSIPGTTSVVLKAGAPFGTITSADISATVNNVGTSDNHQIVVGDGNGTDSYIDTTDVTNASAAHYAISFGTSGGSTIDSLTDHSTYATLVVSDTDPAASIDVIITNAAGNAMPTLGTGGTPNTAFAVLGTTLDIPASSTVPFSGGKAALNLMMDLDEGSITLADAAGNVSFTMTLTAFGL